MVNGLPEFRFAVDGVAVRERIEAASGGGLRCTFAMEQPTAEIEFQAPPVARVSSPGAPSSTCKAWRCVVRELYDSPSKWRITSAAE